MPSNPAVANRRGTASDREALRRLVEELDDADEHTHRTYAHSFVGVLHAGHFANVADTLEDKWRLAGVHADLEPIESGVDEGGHPA